MAAIQKITEHFSVNVLMSNLATQYMVLLLSQLYLLLIHALKNTPLLLIAAIGHRALYLACRALARSGTLLDTNPSVQKHDKESLFPYLFISINQK